MFEEPDLKTIMGEEYVRYCQHVPAFFPTGATCPIPGVSKESQKK